MSNAMAMKQDAPVATSMADMLERLVMSPDIDVGKLEKLLAMQERILARNAEQHFNEAMNDAQEEMRIVSQDASNPQTKSKYASYQALDKALRPIYSKHGFSISFDTADGAPADHVRVVAKVGHRSGHSERPHLDMPSDGKGAKGGDVMTKTHATMSAVSYARRGLLKMIFNIAEGKDDDDGSGAGAGDFLSSDQVQKLQRIIVARGADLEALLKYCKVPRLEDIYATKFDAVIKVIDQKWPAQ